MLNAARRVIAIIPALVVLLWVFGFDAAPKRKSSGLEFGFDRSTKGTVTQDSRSACLRYVKPFEAINSAALPKALLQSELVGHEKDFFYRRHAPHQRFVPPALTKPRTTTTAWILSGIRNTSKTRNDSRRVNPRLCAPAAAANAGKRLARLRAG